MNEVQEIKHKKRTTKNYVKVTLGLDENKGSKLTQDHCQEQRFIEQLQVMVYVPVAFHQHWRLFRGQHFCWLCPALLAALWTSMKQLVRIQHNIKYHNHLDAKFKEQNVSSALYRTGLIQTNISVLLSCDNESCNKNIR